MSSRVSIAIFAIVLFLSCKKSDNSASPGPNEVWMVYKNFRPQQLSVEKGTTVLFMNKDNSSHTATENSGMFYSGKLKPDENFEFTFDTKGIYEVYCNPHSSLNTERCIIEVK